LRPLTGDVGGDKGVSWEFFFEILNLASEVFFLFGRRDTSVTDFL